MSRPAIARLLPLCLAVCANPALAQAPGANRPEAVAELRDAPPSRRLRVALQADAVLERGGEEFGGVTASRLARDSRGRYFHVNYYVPSRVLVFDPSGRYLAAFGREGKGPGEFNLINAIFVGRGDTLHIFDEGRYLVFSPGLQHVRTVGTGTGPVRGFAELRPGSSVISAVRATRASSGKPLHHLSASSLGGSFGRAEQPAVNEPPALQLERRLARASDSTFWAAGANRYQLELWNHRDRLLLRLQRSAPWFDLEPRTTLEGRFNPAIVCLLRDSADRLWVIANARDRRVKELFEFVGPEIGPYRIRNNRLKTPAPDRESLGHDGMIEVIDPARREVIASRRLDAAILGCPDQSRIYTAHELPDGSTRLNVWRLSLERHEGGSK